MPKKGSTRLTMEKIVAFEHALADGLPLKFARYKLGIGESTTYLYFQEAEKLIESKRKGKSKKDKLLLELVEARKRGETACVERNLLIIGVAAKDSWQAAAWLLERRHPEEFGRFDRIEHSGKLERVRSDEEIQKEIDEIEARLATLDRRAEVPQDPAAGSEAGSVEGQG